VTLTPSKGAPCQEELNLCLKGKEKKLSSMKRGYSIKKIVKRLQKVLLLHFKGEGRVPLFSKWGLPDKEIGEKLYYLQREKEKEEGILTPIEEKG